MRIKKRKKWLRLKRLEIVGVTDLRSGVLLFDVRAAGKGMFTVIYEKKFDLLSVMPNVFADCEYLLDESALICFVRQNMDAAICEENKKIPDNTISVEEMNVYGYLWDGMLPIGLRMAMHIWEMNICPVYLLYKDNSEGMALDMDEILNHYENGGIFGVEKDNWLNRVSA